MSKLGYTFYPKDWTNSEKVFELTLAERGFYRELIDMAMLNDNKIVINYKVWCRKFASTEDELETILITLTGLKLIEINLDVLSVPSCEERLKYVRAGRKGGKVSKPIVKEVEKPKPKQKEVKVDNNLDYDKFIKWFNNKKLEFTGKLGKTKSLTITDKNNLKSLKKDYEIDDFNHAILNMFSNKWAKDNNMFIPSHFLRNDNFIKYHSQDIVKNNEPPRSYEIK